MDFRIPVTNEFDTQDVFVNRENERSRLTSALAAHSEVVAAGGCDPSDLFVPRRNVLVFYGVGGYGKTQLSRQLESELADQADERNRGKRKTRGAQLVTVRIDLASGWDFESMLLGVRAQLATLDLAFPAFDIAFSKYWALNRPGVELHDYLKGHQILHSISGAINLPDQLKTALEAAASTIGWVAVPGASTAWSFFSELARVIRARKDMHDAVTRCPEFPELLEAADDPEALSRFPQMLAWELYHRRDRRQVSLVVFVDSFGESGDRVNHQVERNRQVERYLQRMIWLMPNAFFLVTGRERVDWGDDDLARELDVVGPSSWPGLAAESLDASCQHTLGGLSDAHADEFLRSKVRFRTPGQNREPGIPEAIRHVIVANARGWPEYLNLSVERFLEHRGETPSPEDFSGGFRRLMLRICQGLDIEEQAVLRAVSILDGFDLPLAAATAGTSEGAAQAFADRSLVLKDPEGFWPYFLSERVRCHIPRSDQLLGSWTEDDWRNAARRAVAEMGQRFERTQSRYNRVGVINYLNQSLRIAHEYKLELGWITDAAYAYVEDYLWEPTLLPTVPDANSSEDITSPAQALALALTAIRERQSVHRSVTLAKLQMCRTAKVLSDAADDLVAYFYAECLRDLGRPDESERTMGRLIGDDRRISLQASEGVIYAQRRRGRLREAHAGIEGLVAGPLRARLLGDVLWNEALFDAADSAYTESRELALGQGLIGHAAEAEASRAFALGFTGGAHAMESIEKARELLGAARIRWADLQAGNAELLVVAGRSGDFGERCQTALKDGEEAGLSSIVAYAALAAAYDAAIRRDNAALVAARQRLAGLVTEHQFGYLLEIVDFWQPESSKRDTGCDWPDGVEVTARRWREVLETRRA